MKRYIKQLGICLLALSVGILLNQCEDDQIVGSFHGGQTNYGTPAVSTNYVTNITSSSASCGGEVTSDGGSYVTTRGFCYSTSQSPTISNTHTSNESGTGSFSASITGLSAGKTYYVRAYATNSEGTSYGEQRSFTTLSTGGTTVLQESFENGIPSSWDVLDQDGDGYCWEVNDSFDGHNGGRCASSASYINNIGAVTPKNWLITPSLYLSGNATLTYWVAVQDADWASEHYGVYISSGGSTTYHWLFDETMTAKGDGKAQGAWYQRSINLSDYSGETVRIAFIHLDCTDQFWLNLDDVKVVIQ